MMKVLNEFAHDMASYFFKSSTTAPVRIAKNETEHNDESVANSVQEFNPSALKEPSALPTQNPGTAPSQIPFVDEVLEKTFQQEEVVVDPSESQRATASYFQGTTSSLPVPVETRSAVQDISDPQAIPDFAKTVVQDLTTEMPPPIATSMAIQTHTGTQAISSGAYSMVQELGSENQLSNEILSMPNQIPPLEQKVPEDLNAQEQSITGQTLKMAAEQVTLPPAQKMLLRNFMMQTITMERERLSKKKKRK
uniref:Uncharacterized protein n=1 Tax=Plectus sambesii TaxID=2011161 RepID=A0A914XGU8_9BILA